MLSNPTTFILGAGASCDFDFPTGAQLQKEIANALGLADNLTEFANERIRQEVQQQLRPQNWMDDKAQYLSAASRIIAGMPVAGSIDNYLHTHQNDHFAVRLGKLAIAYVILQAERKSALYLNDVHRRLTSQLSSKKYEDSWYSPFIRMLTAGTQSGDPHALFQNVRFVVFNYDRCLELVLLLALQNYYGLPDQEALEILSGIEIIHPYGSFGSLNHGEANSLPFGAEDPNLFEISQRIRTFTESVEDSTVLRAQQSVAGAYALVFLGFGFLRQNMDLLAPQHPRSATRIHATTFGVSEADQVVVQEQLKRFVATPDQLELGEIMHVAINGTRTGFIDVKNKTCVELIKNHHYRLTA